MAAPRISPHRRALAIARAALLFLAAAVPAARCEPVVVTLAGSGPTGWGNGAYGGDGLTGSEAFLDGPASVALDASGRLMFADYWNNRIRAVDPAGKVSTIAGSGWVGYESDGAALGTSLWGPWGVARRGTGFVFSDTFNSIIRAVDGTGALTRIAGTTGDSGFGGDYGSARSALLDWPLGVATDNAGNVYVADSWNHRIRRIGTDGVITTVAGDGWSDAFGRGRYAGDGGQARFASLNWPTELAVAADGSIYVADTYNQRIRRIDGATGVITTLAGNGEVGNDGDGGDALAARLNHPAGIAVSGSTIYIADSLNHRIRKVSNGVIEAVAGSGTRGLSQDPSPAASARFQEPRGLAVLANGDLLVADTGNNRLRRVIFGDTGTVTGTVRDMWTMEPIPGAIVAWDGITARSDASGRYTLGAAAGTQLLSASAPTYGTVLELVSIVPDAPETHDFALPSGRIQGHVTDDAGHIVAGATVTSPDVTITTGADGSFTLRSAPGPVTLKAQALGFASGSTTVNVTNGATTDVRIVVHRTRSFALPLAYDADWISWNGNPGDYTTPSSDYCFPAEELPASNSVFTFTHENGWVDFLFPSKEDGANNALMVNGQTLSITPGRYSALHLLDSSQFGAWTGAVTLRYADGGTTSVSLRWSDWAWNAIGQSLGENETVAIPCTHRHNGSNANAAPPVDILHSLVPVDSARTLTGVTLPADPNGLTSQTAYIFAASLDQVDGGATYGDVNSDGSVTVADAGIVFAAAAGLRVPTSDERLLGDLWPAYPAGAFGDGSLTLGDAVAVLRKAQGL